METEKNPLLNFMPEKMTKEEFFQRIREIPKLDKEASVFDRILQLSLLRQSLFTPLTFQYYFWVKLMAVFNESYVARTPVDWIKSIRKVKEGDRIAGSEVDNQTVLGFAFLGVSGMGKTSIVKRVLRLMPQVINHVNLGIRQVTYLKVDCTVKGSTKQICISVLNELDRVLGTNYFQQHGRESEERLVISMGLKAVAHRLGVLIIDELHNLETSNENVRKKIMNFFKTLTNTVGVPIIYIGTDQAAPILFGDFQTASRVQGIGMPPLDKFKKEDEEWIFFLKQLWKQQVLREPGELTSELMAVYYRESQGILRQVIQVHCLVQEIALSNQSETIKAEYFDAVKGQLIGTAKTMDSLQDRDWSTSKAGADVQMTHSHMYGLGSSQEQTVEFDFLLGIAKKEWPNANVNQLKECIRIVLKDFKTLTTDQKCEKLKEGVGNLERDGELQSKIKGKPKGDMIEACENANSSTDYYNLLKQSNFIMDFEAAIS